MPIAANESIPSLLPLLQLLHPAPSVVPPQKTDWAKLFTPSLLQRFSCLVESQALAKGLTLPPRLAEQISNISKRQQLRTLASKVVLRKVLVELCKDGIDCIVLKGAHLAQSAYRLPCHRFFCDIDILVREKDVDAACTSLSRADFYRTDPDLVVLAKDHHLVFTSPKLAIPLELHWQLHSCDHRAGQGPVESAWQWSSQGALAGVSTKLMKPEYLIVYLCSHATRHHFDQGPIVLVDLAYLIYSSEDRIDWLKVKEAAAELRAEHSVLLILSSLQLMMPELCIDWVGESALSTDLGRMVLDEMYDPETPEQRRIRKILTLNDSGPSTGAIAREYRSQPAYLAPFVWARDRLAATDWRLLLSRVGRTQLRRRLHLHRLLEADLNPRQSFLAKLSVWIRSAFAKLLTTIASARRRLAGRP